MRREARVEMLRRQIDELAFNLDVCRGCGVDRRTDWQGYHRPGCWVARILE